MPKRQPWHAVSRELVDCAMGRVPADLLIRDGQWVCVQSGEIVPHTDIAVKGSRIAYVGPDASHTLGILKRHILREPCATEGLPQGGRHGVDLLRLHC